MLQKNHEQSFRRTEVYNSTSECQKNSVTLKTKKNEKEGRGMHVMVM